jgi:hypothetical protein
VRGPQSLSPLRYKIAMPPGAKHEHAYVSETSDVGYVGLAASDTLLYALFVGCPGRCGIAGAQVQVFRWDGSFVRAFALDKRALMIAVDPGDRWLYAVFATDSRGYDQHIGEWRLPTP